MENFESSSIDAIKRARLDIQAQFDPWVKKYVRTGVDLILISTAEGDAARLERLRAIAQGLDAMIKELEANTKSA